MEISFTVPGEPVGKGRPRVTRRGAFTPDKTRHYERLVRYIYTEKYGEFSFPAGDPLVLVVNAYFAIPKSANKKKHALMVAGTLRPTKTPDFDNIGKIVSDGLQGVAYPNDSQIVTGVVHKFYSAEPRVEVILMEDEHIEEVKT